MIWKWLVLTGLLLPGTAAAHLVSTRFGELYSGMLHPLTSLQHVVPWIAIGLLGGLQSAATARWALLAFPLTVLLGLGLASVLPELAFVNAVNVASFVVIGFLVAFKLRLGKRLFLSLVVLFGLSHGYANAAPNFNGFEWLLYAIGVGLTAYLLITLITATTQAFAAGRGWTVIAVRAVGSWIAAAGTLYAGLLFINL